jgi:hypothetical protein
LKCATKKRKLSKGKKIGWGNRRLEGRPMRVRWLCLLSLLVVLFTVSMVSGSEQRDISLLERLAQKIEKAQKLSPEAERTITQLLAAARQRDASRPNVQAENARGKAAIERVAKAIKTLEAKQSVHTVSTVDASLAP